MSIMKAGKYYELTCDICGDESGVPFDDFQEAVDYKKANDWKSKKYGVDWVDICPDCQDK